MKHHKKYFIIKLVDMTVALWNLSMQNRENNYFGVPSYRSSNDGTKILIKFINNTAPSYLTGHDPYTYEQIAIIMNSPEWSKENAGSMD
jgi:hypothetical protein